MKIAIVFLLSIASLAGASARAADLDITVADVRVAIVSDDPEQTVAAILANPLFTK